MNQICRIYSRTLPVKFLSTLTFRDQPLLTTVIKPLEVTTLTNQRFCTEAADGSSDVNKLHKERITAYETSNVVCYVCKGIGHIAANCPNVRQLCHRCGKPGHLSRACPEQKGCYRCGNITHLAKDCPQVICYRCMKSGHLARDCPQIRACYKCGKPGHIARDCQETQIAKSV